MKITQQDLEDHGLPLVFQFRAALAAGGGVRPFIELVVDEDLDLDPWSVAPAMGERLADGLRIAVAPFVDELGHQPRFLSHPMELYMWPQLRGKRTVPIADVVRLQVLEWLAWWYMGDDDHGRQCRLARAWERNGIPKALRPATRKAA